MPEHSRGVVHADSRWWYWVAALPAIVALWVASAIWVGLGVSLGGGGGWVGGQGLVLLPAVALGAPAVVVFLLLPIALWRDGTLVRRAGAGWPDHPVGWAGVAALIDLGLLAGIVMLSRLDRTLGLGLVLVAVVAGTALAVFYLKQRSRHVWTPTSFWELKHELEPR